MPKRKAEVVNEPWERQQSESEEAYEAFSVYRDMLSKTGKRSTAKVGQELGKSKTLMDNWCKRWNWVERARTWDNELARQGKEQAAKDAREMQQRHVKIAKKMQLKALEALETLDPEMLDGNIVVKLIVEGTKLERSAREAGNDMASSGKEAAEDPLAGLVEAIDRADKRRQK